MLLSGAINLNRCSCGKGEVIVRNFPDTESEKLTELEFSLKIYKKKKKQTTMRGMWTWSCYESQRNKRMLFNLNELGKQTKACFRLFMQSWKAVFVSCVSFFSKLFGHCDKSNASVSLNCMLISSQWKLRNAEPVETLFPLCFSPQEKKKVFLKSWCLLSCVPQVTLTFSTRQAVDSDELLLDPGR